MRGSRWDLRSHSSNLEDVFRSPQASLMHPSPQMPNVHAPSDDRESSARKSPGHAHSRDWRRSTRGAHPGASDGSGPIGDMARPAPSQLPPPRLCTGYHSLCSHVWKPDSMPCGLAHGNLHWRMLVWLSFGRRSRARRRYISDCAHPPEESSTSTTFQTRFPVLLINIFLAPVACLISSTLSRSPAFHTNNF